ncbi:MAG TPA: alpha-amylase/4-alpha-glucanotransferase domain-containing protein [Terriglobales bacterium]|nr:alpha-amylase/4-alpha-glucanotransferase domain-containing protein [Terriglobales bacterium]
MAIAFALLLHAHQPAGNFDSVIEQTYQSAYAPFLAAAARRPWLRLNLHFSGFLLDWLADHHPEYLDQLRALQAANRLELLGGGYYEPILSSILAADQQDQLARLSATLKRHFGVVPRGAWLAERVWEPGLAAVLARAGLRYTMLDDSHFEQAGIAADDLHGYWLTESQGETLALIPSNYFLRQALPFRPVAEGLEYLSAAALRHPGSLLTMGDDLEKFGSWPHTAQHVYQDGWLESCFDRLEALQDQVATVRLSDYFDGHPPRGLVYIPTASYPEMMRWAGSASWHGFLTKYPEANLLHKSQLDLSRRCAAAPAARTHLLAAQCNDVYWHGWFGGLYSPHLRNLAFTRLLAADRLLAASSPRPRLRRWDLLCDGSETLELRSTQLRLLLAPADGGTAIELDALAADANLVNSIRLRPEPYHQDLRRHAAANPAGLPGEAASPAADLESKLIYDVCAPSCARLYRDDEPDQAAYQVTSVAPAGCVLSSDGTVKTFVLDGNSLRCQCTWPTPAAARWALEWILNLLAADAPDRGLLHAGRRYPLAWSGNLPAGALTLCDGWRKLHIELDAPGASGWQVRPRYSVSQSEQGFEAVYQGSAIRAIWPAASHGSIASQLKIFPCHCHF